MKTATCKVCGGAGEYYQEEKNRMKKCIFCNKTGKRERVDVLSLGAGTQSSALLDMAINGEIKLNGETVTPDLIIFANVKWEPIEVYYWLGKLKAIAARKGYDIVEVSGGNIKEDTLKAARGEQRAASMPFYTLNPKKRGKDAGGIVRRQCTYEYKIAPINKYIKNWLGYEKGQIVKHQVHIWKGITTDEITRVKPSEENWSVFEYPLIEQYMDRLQAIKRAEQMQIGTPPASSCIGCPFHDAHYWQKMQRESPGEFAEAVEFDEAIRKHAAFNSELYLFQGRQPLKEADFGGDLFNMFENDCDGFCGV